MRALIIEDEIELQTQIRLYLEAEGYRVDVCGDGHEGLHMASEYPVDVAILDLGLPGISGLEILKRLREKGSQLPICVLTARGRWQDRVEGLEAGADDYLAKPFQMEELSARLHALLRRSIGAPQSLLHCGPLTLNLASRQITLHGAELKLTNIEYRMLEYLMQHQGRVVSRDEMRDYLYSDELNPESNVIEVVVGRLRRKLDPNGESQLIETLRGRGYRLTP